MVKLEISRATLKRDIAKLRDQLHVPIEFNRELCGYTLAAGQTDSEFPGLWLKPTNELQACRNQLTAEKWAPYPAFGQKMIM